MGLPSIVTLTKLAAPVGVAVQLWVVDWTSMACAETRSTTGAGGVPCGMIPTSATWEQPFPPVSGPALNGGAPTRTRAGGPPQFIGGHGNVALAVSSSTLAVWIHGRLAHPKVGTPELAACVVAAAGS